MHSITDLVAPLLALLAIPLVAVFLLDRGEPFIAVAVLNVLLIAGSLLYVVTSGEGAPGGAAH